MNGKEADDRIQKITRLLEKGGTMLAAHHECGAPLFRYQGKTVCPVCDFKEKQEVKQEQKAGQRQGEEQEPPQKMQKTQQTDSHEINRIIMSKIQNIAASLEAETDLARVKDKMECIEQGLRILKLLKD